MCRTAHNYVVNGVTQRTLIKAYGLKFIIVVTGRAGKFNIVPLLITIGSGIGLLSIATIIADLAISTFSKEKQLYNDLIVLDTVKQEEEKVKVRSTQFTCNRSIESILDFYFRPTGKHQHEIQTQTSSTSSTL